MQNTRITGNDIQAAHLAPVTTRVRMSAAALAVLEADTRAASNAYLKVLAVHLYRIADVDDHAGRESVAGNSLAPAVEAAARRLLNARAAEEFMRDCLEDAIEDEQLHAGNRLLRLVATDGAATRD